MIDDQLRAAILGSRFVIADLTHGNNGAYWEAGFGEGRGLPVIYTCEEAAWKSQKTHFDTNHLRTIIWNERNFAKAGNELAATIRATLPNEAIQDNS
jgi:catalase (peroxidase I)